MAEETIKMERVPAMQVNQLVAEYELDKPVKVTKVQNPDGTFDVIIVFNETR
jgi:hypothetical protein